jgi:hypothetical protein
MSTLELENIKHPDNSGDNIALASNGSITIDRKSTDGKVIVFRKDGTAVGSIGVEGANLSIDGGANKVGLQFRGAEIRPRDNDVAVDGTVDFGNASNRFKDLYLSGGVYLGGTSAANKLDDFEEGTWTMAPNISTNVSILTAYVIRKYTKVGSLVTVSIYAEIDSVSGNDYFGLTLPFTSGVSIANNNSTSAGGMMYERISAGPQGLAWYIAANQNYIRFYKLTNGAQWIRLRNSDLNANSGLYLTASYHTDA